MRQQAVILARVLGYVDVNRLSGGRVYGPSLIAALVEKFKFQKFPQAFEETDLQKGIEFLGGLVGKQPVHKFAIWDSLLVVETGTGTDESKAAMEEILLWAVENFQIDYSPGSIERFAYVSDVSFQSNAPVLGINLAAKAIADRASKELTEIWKEPVRYEPIILRIGHDPTARTNGIAPFTIERRGGVTFSENKYFSEAPLPTRLHWEMLEQFEKEMIAGAKLNPAKPAE